MADFHVRADSVDVEQIMRQIRARIREKRGVDYTEEQIQELARVKLERFLDPKGIRSDLLEEFRRTPVGEYPPNYEFNDQTLFTSDKALVRAIRTLLRPLLKLFFNPNTLNLILSTQSRMNQVLIERANRDALVFELMHNLVLELTRTSIEVKNLKMRVESLSSRLDFAERRARALEAVVQYRPDAAERSPREGRRPETAPAGVSGEGGSVDPITGGESLRTRRRRRRRGRRSGPGFAGGAAEHAGAAEGEPAEGTDPGSQEPAAEGAPASAQEVAPPAPADDRGGSEDAQAGRGPSAGEGGSSSDPS